MRTRRACSCATAGPAWTRRCASICSSPSTPVIRRPALASAWRSAVKSASGWVGASSSSTGSRTVPSSGSMRSSSCRLPLRPSRRVEPRFTVLYYVAMTASPRARTLAPMSSRLLLIDDDARLSSMVGEYLRGAGFEVDTAGSLAAGRERLAAGNYDALVLDLMLPAGDGLDLCRDLRANNRTRALALLMLTARGPPRSRLAR